MTGHWHWSGVTSTIILQQWLKLYCISLKTQFPVFHFFSFFLFWPILHWMFSGWGSITVMWWWAVLLSLCLTENWHEQLSSIDRNGWFCLVWEKHTKRNLKIRKCLLFPISQISTKSIILIQLHIFQYLLYMIIMFLFHIMIVCLSLCSQCSQSSSLIFNLTLLCIIISLWRTSMKQAFTTICFLSFLSLTKGQFWKSYVFFSIFTFRCKWDTFWCAVFLWSVQWFLQHHHVSPQLSWPEWREH